MNFLKRIFQKKENSCCEVKIEEVEVNGEGETEEIEIDETSK